MGMISRYRFSIVALISRQLEYQEEEDFYAATY
jgi:hypothetical protein